MKLFHIIDVQHNPITRCDEYRIRLFNGDEVIVKQQAFMYGPMARLANGSDLVFAAWNPHAIGM